MDDRRINRGDRHRDDGSTDTLTGSGSEEERTPRGDREKIHDEKGANADICKQYSNGNALWSGKNPRVQKVLSWNVAGMAEDSTDIFLSQISMLTDWDVLLLQECFRKLDGVNVGAHELFTPCELLSGRASEMERTDKRCWWSEQVQSSWMDR